MSRFGGLSKEDANKCQRLLGDAEMFKKVSSSDIELLVKQMKLRELDGNDVLIRQGDETDRFFLLQQGDIRRKRIDPETGKSHLVEFHIKAKSINSMRVMSGEKAFSTVKCVAQKCRFYEMARADFLKVLQNKPEITLAIAEGLSEQLRTGSKKFATPLLQQQQQDVNVPAVSIAAGIESYYRSALNAMLNTRLTGVKAELFPNMHIQVPVRIAYITGFKGLRAFLDHHVDADSLYRYPSVRISTAIAPGIIMTPISSVLEASNAGHMNKEPMMTRWMRGVVPRGGREIIFGVGLNQMSDYCEERVNPYFQSAMMANAAGSLVAGVISGYLSHVPHNISTFKLLEPSRSYGELYRQFVDKSVPPVIDKTVKEWPETTRQVTRTIFATLFPRGVAIRTTQIVGSFIILNGTINYLQLREHHKIQQALHQS